MKTLRYLLVAIVVMLTAQSVSAQEYTRINSVAGCTTFGQTERQYKFHSTSAILMADTQLGLAEGGAQRSMAVTLLRKRLNSRRRMKSAIRRSVRSTVRTKPELPCRRDRFI